MSKAGSQFELIEQGRVRFYARNDGLGLVIPYEYMGVAHNYEPDLLVRLNVPGADLTLALEVKGYEDDQTKAKHGAAKRWVAAVNNWGKLGRWAFHVCRNAQVLDREISFIRRGCVDRGRASNVVTALGWCTRHGGVASGSNGHV
jgi:type III restriction enzyme